MKYKVFKRDFEASGMTQVDYADSIGISPSMVSYYLSRARKEVVGSPSFTTLEVVEEHGKKIIIRTSAGVEIEVPL